MEEPGWQSTLSVLRRFARTRLAAADADDVVAESAMRLMRFLHHHRVDNELGLALRIARFECGRFFHHRARSAQPLPLVIEIEAERERDATESTERREWLAKRAADLAPRQRAVVETVLDGASSIRDVARRLGMQPKDVRDVLRVVSTRLRVEHSRDDRAAWLDSGQR